MLISLNGVRTPPEDATLSVFDRGFLFGDAIYEVICTHEGRPFLLGAHLDRLEASGKAIGLDVQPMRAGLEAEIEALVAEEQRTRGKELYIRIMITRGVSPDFDLLSAEGEPLQVVLVKPLPAWDERLFREGMRLRSVRPEEVVGRIAPWVKSNNRQANVMAHRLAREAGCDDALFVDPDGNVTEGPSWNVFCVQGGALVTPPLERGILPGITRSTVLRLAREAGIEAREPLLSLDRARESDEMFVTSTTRGVMPVAELDGRRFSPVPGPVTQRLREAFLALTQE